MDASELFLALIPALNDPPFRSQDYQAELRQFEQDLQSKGLEVSPIIELREAWTPVPFPAPYVGDFITKLAAIVGPAFGMGVGAWLHARYGRRVRLKVGDIEAEAQTLEEVEKLLTHALEIQRSNQPKVILKP